MPSEGAVPIHVQTESPAHDPLRDTCSIAAVAQVLLPDDSFARIDVVLDPECGITEHQVTTLVQPKRNGNVIAVTEHRVKQPDGLQRVFPVRGTATDSHTHESSGFLHQFGSRQRPPEGSGPASLPEGDHSCAGADQNVAASDRGCARGVEPVQLTVRSSRVEPRNQRQEEQRAIRATDVRRWHSHTGFPEGIR